MKKDYVSKNILQVFLNNLKDTFALLTHSHTVEEITDLSLSDYYTRTEVDNIAEQKSQVQIITWEADD